MSHDYHRSPVLASHKVHSAGLTPLCLEQEMLRGFLSRVAEFETASDLTNLICRFPDQVEMAMNYGWVVDWGDTCALAGQNDTFYGDAFGRNNASSRIEDDCKLVGCSNGTFPNPSQEWHF